MAKSRLSGGYPAIGIRPIVEERGREGVAPQAMAMADKVKALYEDNLKYSNGEPVRVVVADAPIAGAVQASACAEKFRKEGVAITVTVSPTWSYSTETMELDPLTIKALWGLNATERPGAVYTAAAKEAYSMKGLPIFNIYGREILEPEDDILTDDVAEKLLRFGRAAVAAATMREKSWLQIGTITAGIGASFPNTEVFEQYLGMRLEMVDEIEVLRRMDKGIYDKEGFEKALAWTRENCREGLDDDPAEAQRSREQKDKDWADSVKIMCIIKDLMDGNDALKDSFPEEAIGHNAIGGGFQGQRQWTDYQTNTDFAESLLNTTFDWEGVREPYLFTTENDSFSGLGMLFMKLLTNGPQMFSDVRSYWSGAAVKRATGYELEGHAKEADGFIHLINSGPSPLEFAGEIRDEAGNAVLKPWYEMTDADVKACLDATEWSPVPGGYAPNGGYGARFLTRSEMPATMVRLTYVQDLGPALQIAEGWTVALPDEVSDIIWKRTNYTWPCTWFTPRIGGGVTSAYDLMNAWAANHGAVSYGHVGADLITLASILRIPVCLHNVEAADILRPSAWDGFGSCREGADYRACQAFGPLYKGVR